MGHLWKNTKKTVGDLTALLLALRSFAQAQGGIGKFAKWTEVSREHLSDILASKHNPQLDNLLVQLERRDSTTEQSTLPDKASV
ncbi:hypothetical protein FJZ31_04820 [Candidatus Poribacteria bacterium]|nr:hypothetical protein [Candidatus Poribacteria bacterium]